jgi:hypothetical protein
VRQRLSYSEAVLVLVYGAEAGYLPTGCRLYAYLDGAGRVHFVVVSPEADDLIERRDCHEPVLLLVGSTLTERGRRVRKEAVLCSSLS